MSPGGRPETNAARPRHLPVLLSEVLETLAPQPGDRIIDGTFGAGGYTRAILEHAPCTVVAFDRDITAIRSAAPLVAHYAGSLTLVYAPFSGLEARSRAAFGAPDTGPFADGVVLDIGVSSMQIDEADRGFSFLHDGPLDMRMSTPFDPESPAPIDTGPSAADFLNTADEEDIANVIYNFGEERRSRAIARAIVERRAEKKFERTGDLADLVFRVMRGRREDGKHPATRTFQALRIHINDELGELERGLAAAEKILKAGGRLVVVTFHSLEDRIVKRFFTERTGKADQGSRHLPARSIKFQAPSFRIVNSRPLTPQKGELDVNPRSRSARLRAAVRTDAPVWQPA